MVKLFGTPKNLVVLAGMLAAAFVVFVSLANTSPVSAQSDETEVSRQWSDGNIITATIRIYAGQPSYLPSGIDTGGGDVEIGPWGDKPADDGVLKVWRIEHHS